MSNIVFSKPNSSEIRVVDFGISGLQGPFNNSDKTIAGSLKYMAPEVLTGKNAASEPAIDIFSLGVILFHFVCGKLPFEGENEAIKQMIVSGNYTFPSNRQISPECKDLI